MRPANVLVWIALIAGCGGDDGDSGGPIAIEDLDSMRRVTICRIAARCGLIDDVPTCLRLRLGPPTVDPSLVEAVKAGKVVYDATKARACIDGMSAWTCNRDVAFDSRFEPPECDELFSGTLAAAAPCGIDEACISQVCSVTGPCPPNTCCQGTCSGATPPPPRPRLGEVCSFSGCVDSFCDQMTMRCVALKPAGSTCTGSDECGRGLTCSSPGICEALPAIGQACPDQECGDIGAFCSPATARCERVGLTDDPCDPAKPCSPEIYACIAGKCALGPQRGEACAGQCIDNSFCEPSSSICVPPRPDGSSCNSSRECASNRCDPNTMTCLTPPICF